MALRVTVPLEDLERFVASCREKRAKAMQNALGYKRLGSVALACSAVLSARRANRQLVQWLRML